ncbi:hypothetical protein [Actinoplanes flavus]|uniref:SUKH-4 immunity protein n=1 Tax=Actinoplanes flavus TaxID=2820290 RepID=A0ABS3UMZ1_9ACTN|nr:hypothetical protein [Actinoplanes flavus]MBO3740137.1 hypothetical protein [Actinoplanes flavus]
MLDLDQSRDYVSRYDGVDSSVLTDGSWLLDQPGFWMSLVDGFTGADLWPDLDVLDDITVLYERIRESGTWPVLQVTDHLAVIVWHGYDDEGGIDYVILPPGTGRCLSIAAVEGHGHGPGLSWPEAMRAVDHGRLGTPAQRLLLLLPAVGDADTPPAAIDLVVSALRELVAPEAESGDLHQAAEEMLDSDVTWSTGDTATCEADHAPRGTGGLPPAELALITRALS